MGFITQIKNFGKFLDLGFIVNPTMTQSTNPMKSPPWTKLPWAPMPTLDHRKAKSIGAWGGGFSKEAC